MPYTDQDLESLARQLWDQKRSDALFNLHSMQDYKGFGIEPSARTLTDEDYLKKYTIYDESLWPQFLHRILSNPNPADALEQESVVRMGGGSRRRMF